MARKGEKLSPEAKAKLNAASKPYQFKRGAPSPNPSGRPKHKPFLMALKEIMKDNPEIVRGMVESAVAKALEGDKDSFKELRDMADGKPAIAITAGTDDDGAALPTPIVNVNFVPAKGKKA